MALGAHSQPFRLQQFALGLEFDDPLLELFTDPGAQRAISLSADRHELFGWKNVMGSFSDCGW